MAASFDTFQRMKDKGIAAYKAGDFAAARTYLIEAAETMLDLASDASNPQLRRQQEEYAAEMIALAKQSGRRQDGRRREAGRSAAREDDQGSAVSDWIVRERPEVRFEDVAGLDDVKEEIRLKMIYPFTHPELAERFGIGRGGGILLFGPPGTGKTMIAKAICGEIEATFFVISPAQMLSKWVGEAEQNVARLFAAAKAERRSVIFIDEVEALVPKRRGSSSTVMQRVVPQILQELEGFERKGDGALLFVGATNEPWALDSAMLRPGRLDSKIYVPLPDAPARFRMLEMYLAPKPLAEDVEFGELCDLLEGYSGADIRNICQRAAALPFLEAAKGGRERAVTRADLLDVIRQTPPSVDPKEIRRFEQYAGGE